MSLGTNRNSGLHLSMVSVAPARANNANNSDIILYISGGGAIAPLVIPAQAGCLACCKRNANDDDAMSTQCPRNRTCGCIYCIRNPCVPCVVVVVIVDCASRFEKPSTAADKSIHTYLPPSLSLQIVWIIFIPPSHSIGHATIDRKNV